MCVCNSLEILTILAELPPLTWSAMIGIVCCICFSWGTSWGVDGYMFIQRNVNMCGIALSATYPAV